MSYACDCSVEYDGDTAEMMVERIVKAAKIHECCECGEDIMRGDRYQLISGKWEGGFDRFRTCIPCSRIRDDYCSGGWIYGELRERLWDCLGFDYVNGEDTE